MPSTSFIVNTFIKKKLPKSAALTYNIKLILWICYIIFKLEFICPCNCPSFVVYLIMGEINETYLEPVSTYLGLIDETYLGWSVLGHFVLALCVKFFKCFLLLLFFFPSWICRHSPWDCELRHYLFLIFVYSWSFWHFFFSFSVGLHSPWGLWFKAPVLPFLVERRGRLYWWKADVYVAE